MSPMAVFSRKWGAFAFQSKIRPPTVTIRLRELTELFFRSHGDLHDDKSHADPYCEIGPVVMAAAEGTDLRDIAGKSDIEGISGLWCASLGFSNRRLIEDATRQYERASLLSRLQRPL